MSVNGRAVDPPTGPARHDLTDARQGGIADSHDRRHLDPEILPLLARADATVRRSRELIATLNDLSRVVADAVERTDAWLAASKLNKRRASDVEVGDHALLRADPEPMSSSMLRDASVRVR
jgi:hypothetical protein